ncbi:hypothetical protein VTH06DRAFT_3751 [Thermothelomyces fergusii]
MPPVQVHIKSPINAAKASGVTLQTAAPGAAGPDDGSDDATTTTATTTSAEAAAAAAASPAYCPSSNPPPTRTVPSLQQQPPPPQPGSVPRLPEATGAPAPRTAAAARNVAEGSPGAGGPAPPPPPTAAPFPGVSYPPQMGIPPPQPGHHNQRGTTTEPLGRGAYPGPGPGNYQYYYQQSGSYGPSSTAGGYVPPYQGGGSGGSRGMHENEEEGFLGSALKLAKAAGEKLSAAESEIWRRINGEGN